MLNLTRTASDDRFMPMLVVTLGPGDSVMIGDDVEVSLEQVRREKVVVGVAAPRRLPVYRLDEVKRLDEPEPHA